MPIGAAGAAKLGSAVIGAGTSIYNSTKKKKGTTSTNRETQLPSYLREGSQQAVGLGEKLADRTYDPAAAEGAYGLTPTQQSALQGATSFRGSYQPQLAAAQQHLNAADTTLPQADLSAYMNPYIQQSLQPAADQLSQRYQQERNQRDANAAAHGAFGGIRGEIGDQLGNQQYLKSLSNLYDQGLSQAYNQAANQWSADRAFGANLAQEHANLANEGAQLRANEIRNKLAAGGTQQQANLNLYNASLNYPEQHQLTPLLQAVSTVPHGGTNLVSGQTANWQTTGVGNQIAQGLGGALAGYGAYNQFAGNGAGTGAGGGSVDFGGGYGNGAQALGGSGGGNGAQALGSSGGGLANGLHY